jgi:hypothetical protein
LIPTEDGDVFGLTENGSGIARLSVTGRQQVLARRDEFEEITLEIAFGFKQTRSDKMRQVRR